MLTLLRHLSVFAICLFQAACSVGKDNVLFFTSTSIGVVDADVAPPKFSLGYDRLEGSIGPVTQEGQVMPLLSGIAMSTNPFSAAFGFGLSTTFATGPAAVIATKYAFTEAAPDVETSSGGLNPIDADLQLLTNAGPVIQKVTDDNSAILGAVRVTEEQRRYFFATDTSFGLNVSFGAGSTTLPDSINLGWKRKELAVVPVTRMQDSDGGEYAVLPSLVATSRALVELEGGAGSEQGVGVAQLYATGLAASYLISKPHVRSGVLSRAGVGGLMESLSQVQARGEALRTRLKAALEGLSGSELDDAIAAAKSHGFDVESGGGTDAAKREALLRATIVFNDEGEVSRLADLVDDVEALEA